MLNTIVCSFLFYSQIDGLMTGCAITVPSNVTIMPPQGLGNQFMKKVQMLLNTGLLSYGR